LASQLGSGLNPDIPLPRKLQKTTTFGVRVSKTHHFSEFFSKSHQFFLELFQKSLIAYFRLFDNVSDKKGPLSG
jgi:hypothetical protein